MNATGSEALRTPNRPGFTLVEVIVALLVSAIIGVAVTSVFISQSRFYDRQEKVDFARGVSRSAMNILTSELRMIERDSGVVEATPTRLVLRVPYVMGVSCGGSGTTMTIRYMPTDTIVLSDTASPGYAGYARLRDNGTWRYHDLSLPSAVKPVLNTGAAVCTGAPDTVRAIPGGGTLQVTTPTSGDIAPRGRPVLLYQRITYEFKASAAVPGRIGLYRRVDRKGVDEELVAPFTANARFRFFINDSIASSAAAPANLRQLTGIELVLESASERPDPSGAYPVVPLRTAVFFKNRL